MKEHISVRTLGEAIWELEREYELIQLEIKGVKIWQVIRYEMFNKLLKSFGLYGEAHTQKNSHLNKILSVPMYIFNSIINSPFHGGHKDILIFDHDRKVYFKDEYIDIYTKDLISKISDTGYLVVENDYLRRHWTKKEKNRKYNDNYYISTLFDRMKKLKFSKNERNKIRNLEKIINNHFNLNIDIYNFIIKEIKRFYIQKKYYLKLLNKKKPTKIILVVSYGRQPLISAAKDLNIEVIEIQHGIISPYHLGYSFPYDNKLSYFPDKLWIFGEYWKTSAHFPIETNNISVYGFPYLTKSLEKYKKVEKNKRQIVFLSQGTIGNSLSELAFKVSGLLPDYKVVYKLHPGEMDRWREIYPSLNQAEKLPNFEIVQDNEKNLYEWLAESEYQIGVYSTAIFEGITLNCKTILVNLPGIEYMDSLTKFEEIKCFKPDEKVICSNLQDVQEPLFADNFFFHS
jgi:hypothetical protein